MKPPPGFSSLTAEWHNDTYPSISPSNPALSAKGKTVIVTGGGRGLGPEMGRAFAEAGAARVVLLGRTQSTLEKAKDAIAADFPGTEVSTHVADVADEEAVRKAAEAVGGWEVLVLNAVIAPTPAPIAELSISEWWRGFETNVKGPLVMAQAFLPTHRPNSAIIGITAGSIQLPPSLPLNHGKSAYNSSKIAQVKLLENLAAENPDIFVASVHPGVVMTETGQEAVAHLERPPPIDDIKLAGHFLLWMTSPEAKFLNGRFLWCNWDVDQLKAKAIELEASPQMLTSNILGWPFQP